ncbi:MAG TPA: hypothetical protein VMZ51_07985 [Acidimicrobiales bacterium]|nr:hypothetical protein [Acidimicrobiales bacterium]
MIEERIDRGLLVAAWATIVVSLALLVVWLLVQSAMAEAPESRRTQRFVDVETTLCDAGWSCERVAP